MTSKDLVIICRTCTDCYECTCEKECLAYRKQFKCYPFHVREWRKYPPEAYSETEIKIPFWLSLLYKFIV
jgi:hypothetical protein